MSPNTKKELLRELDYEWRHANDKERLEIIRRILIRLISDEL